MRLAFALLLLSVLFWSCETHETKLFSEVAKSSGIDFINELSYTEEFNPYTYRNFYNGAGVALGDINNDGLLDIYLTGNLVDNKLYLNQGNWQFEDITERAGIACKGVWSTGATFADINSDGFLDLYVCKSGKPEGSNRHNELFINNGDNTFREESKSYGLDITGLSTHAAFFDYDKDGDLDAYILTNSIRSIGMGFDLVKDQREIPDPNNEGNKLLRNDGDFFTDVTIEAGIYTSNIGFGLGITLADINEDGWDDIFVSNDFFERDYLYLNQQNGSFSEVGEMYFQSMSMGSMGADAGDLDNDGDMDLMVTEMLPTTIERQKNKTMFETWDKYQVAVEKGYHHQFSRNALHLNLSGQFSEIGRVSGVSATEWSWGSLICDLDNDGLKDIFVSNGIYKDLLDRDYLTFMANDEQVRQKIAKEGDVITELIDIMPNSPVSNVVFKNFGDYSFANSSEDWGLATPSYSNGSAYGDLDNDGDLDLVVNNIGMSSFLYRNNSDTAINRSIRIKLNGIKNTSGIGALIRVWKNGVAYSSINYPSKGFQSSVDHVIHTGVGSEKELDSVVLYWPEGKKSILKEVRSNRMYVLNEHESNGWEIKSHKREALTLEPFELDIFHKENNHIDFDKERLLFQMYSNDGPEVSVSGSGKGAIIHIGGAKGDSGHLLNFDGKSIEEVSELTESISEDTESLFFDFDNDGDEDLFVSSGGRSFSQQSDALWDRLYQNESGKYVLSNAIQRKYKSTSTVSVADFDNDGDLDLFLGERFSLRAYGNDGRGYLMRNENGSFVDTTKEYAPGLDTLGMVTDSEWLDFDGDGDIDLAVVGDWMGIKLFLNEEGKFIDVSDDYGLGDTRGWWLDLEVADLNGDGAIDLIAGNHGLNSFFKAGTRMYKSDFDRNGTIEHIICHRKQGKYYPIADRDELIAQLPSLKKQILYYKDYSTKTISDLFTEEQLKEAVVFDIDMLETAIFYNQPQGFIREVLPKEAQFSPIYAIESADLDGDGWKDLVVGGNQYLVKPQFGRYDALPGLILFGSADGFSSKNIQFLDLKGQIRDIEYFTVDNRNWLLFGMNNDKARLYEIKE